MIDRAMVDLGGGVGLAVAAGVLISGGLPDYHGWWSIYGVVMCFALAGTFAALIVYYIGLFLRLLAVNTGGSSPLQWFVATTRGSSPRSRWALLICLIVAWTLLMLGVWWVVPGAVWSGAANVFIAALPAVFLLVFGIWVCLLTQRHVHASRYRWARHSADLLIAVLTGFDLLVLFDRDLLATQPAAGLLFPVGAWFSIRTWRVMTGSRRPEVRAGANIALSLLLGVDLVLLLVWGANLVNLSEAEVAVLRSTLEQVGSIADLPWQVWAGLYVLLAGTKLAFALWPERLTAIIRWFQRLRLVPSIDASRRMLTGVHISLLVIVLIAVAAPASVEASLRGPLKAKYIVELQRELEADGEQAAYEEIAREFTASTSTSPSVQPLVAIISKIHSVSSQTPGTSDATSTERDLARRLGQIQAATLQLTATPSVQLVQQAVTNPAQFDPPIRNESDMHDRLDELDAQQRRADTATRQVKEAAEHATTAVANILQIPHVGENEIIQVVREYLSGLVESSPLKEVFAAWAGRLTHATTPPPADKLVVPDPEQLELAALATLTQDQASVQLDPSVPDQVQTRTQTESAADAAVDLANEARYLDEDTGPCNGCPQPLHPGDEHYRDPSGHPVGPEEPPVEPPPVEIPIR